MSEYPQCQHQNGKKHDAEFAVYDGNRSDPDNEHFACEEHLGELLGTTIGFPECREWRVLAITRKGGGMVTA